MALLTNIRLGWKVLEWTKTLASYEHSYITDVKMFMILVPGRCRGQRRRSSGQKSSSSWVWIQPEVEEAETDQTATGWCSEANVIKLFMAVSYEFT